MCASTLKSGQSTDTKMVCAKLTITVSHLKPLKFSEKFENMNWNLELTWNRAAHGGRGRKCSWCGWRRWGPMMTFRTTTSARWGRWWSQAGSCRCRGFGLERIVLPTVFSTSAASRPDGVAMTSVVVRFETAATCRSKRVHVRMTAQRFHLICD